MRGPASFCVTAGLAVMAVAAPLSRGSAQDAGSLRFSVSGAPGITDVPESGGANWRTGLSTGASATWWLTSRTALRFTGGLTLHGRSVLRHSNATPAPAPLASVVGGGMRASCIAPLPGQPSVPCNDTPDCSRGECDFGPLCAVAPPPEGVAGTTSDGGSCVQSSVPVDGAAGAEWMTRPFRRAPLLVGLGVGLHRGGSSWTTSASLGLEMGRSAQGRSGLGFGLHLNHFFRAYGGSRWMVAPGLSYTF